MTDSANYDPDSSAAAQLNKFARDISTFAYNATEEQKEALVRLLNDGPILELLDAWRHTDRRRTPRKPCSLTVYYGIEEKVMTGIVRNISDGGVLIQTFAPLSVGQEITMTIWPADWGEPVETTGEIVWSGSKGVGVRFETPPGEDLQAIIESL